MSRRARSLVVLTGFFTFFTLSASSLVAQAPQKAIKSASDLPAFGYSITGSQDDVIRSEEAFRPFAEKLRRDIESLLRDYSIEDRTTLRGLHQTLLTLDLLENRTAEARKEIAFVRDLEDRPDFKLLSVLFQEALLDSGWPTRDSHEFLRTFSAALNRLPWDVVGDRAKARKGNLEKRPPANQNPPVDTPNGPTVQKTQQLDLRTAQTLANSRYQLAIETPLKDQAVEAFAAYIAAHKDAPPTRDIWPARSVTLHAGDKATPVVIGIWDSGVDRSLFPGQIATDGPVPGWDLYGNPTEGELLIREAPGYGGRDHGTHVAGITLEGNPFGRLVVVRLGLPNPSPWKVSPPPPTLSGIRTFAAGLSQLTAYLREQRARVVNMSWGDFEFEQMLQANGVGADVAERRKMAQEMRVAVRDGVRAALASTPEILYVAAAGNANSDMTFSENLWASVDDLRNLLVVGAVDEAGSQAGFTNFGPAVAVYANGWQVESYIPGGERKKMSGTSMAAPNVTNLAAKLIALDSSLTPADVVKLIMDGCDLSADGRFRRINPKRSVELLQARSGHTGRESSAEADANAGGAYFGKWTLSVARSDFGETMLAFDRAASGEMQMTYLGRSYRFRVDGNDYPAILGMTVAWQQIDPNTWEAVYKRGGNVWTTDTTRLSSDAKALTIDSKGITPSGETNEHTTVYERVSGSSGLIGTWKTKSAPPAAFTALELVPSGTGGLIITRPDGSCDAKFDGNDYPVHGPSVPSGITWAIRRTGPRSFDWTTKLNGDLFAQTSFTISDDGKTLTGIGGRVADTQKTKVVFDRVESR